MLCDALSAIGLEITKVKPGMLDFNMGTEKLHSKPLRKETCPIAQRNTSHVFNSHVTAYKFAMTSKLSIKCYI